MSDDSAKAAILADLVKYASLAELPRADDLTVEDVMRLRGIGRNAANDWLNRLVKSGHLKIVQGIAPGSGRRVNLYRKVEVEG